MATTTYGTPYVQSSDLVSGYPATSSSLATRVDDVSLKGNGVNTQTGTTYTLVLADGGKTVTTSNASPVTVTIPLASSVNFPTGVYVTILNLGAGTMTVQGAGGVTLNGSGTSCAQYEATTLRKTASDTWVAVKGGPGKASVTATTGSPTVTTVGSQTCYKFTGSGSITIGNAGLCDVLVVGGGGGGGRRHGGGGGGGGLLTGTIYLPTGALTVTVGSGGAGSTVDGIPGYTGYPSAIGNSPNYAVAIGGGGGGSASQAGIYGGSSGGSGPANTPATSGLIYQGSNGGAGGPVNTAGGGGGAGGNGAAGVSNDAGDGGTGASNSLTGSAVTYAGGGGGGSDNNGFGAGGSGGGGAGSSTNTTATAGTANTGGGGGGGGIGPAGANGSGGNGGSGIVILLIG